MEPSVVVDTSDNTFPFLIGVCSILGTVLAIGMGIAPLQVINTIRRRGDSKGVNFIPFFGMLLNSVFTTIYGVVVESYSIIFVNGVNVVLSIHCVAVFYAMTLDQKQKKWIQILLISGGSAILAVLFHAYVSLQPNFRRVEMGVINNMITIFLFASPLSTARTVIQTRNAISIPKMFSFISFLTSLVWFFFGFFIDDVFVMFPNAIGVILTLFQLFLIYLYGQHEHALPTIASTQV